MQNGKDATRIRRGHALSEEERAAVDEERASPAPADEVDQPPKRSRAEAANRAKGDRGAADANPEQWEEFTGTEDEPSQREHGSDTAG